MKNLLFIPVFIIIAVSSALAWWPATAENPELNRQYYFGYLRASTDSMLTEDSVFVISDTVNAFSVPIYWGGYNRMSVTIVANDDSAGTDSVNFKAKIGQSNAIISDSLTVCDSILNLLTTYKDAQSIFGDSAYTSTTNEYWTSGAIERHGRWSAIMFDGQAGNGLGSVSIVGWYYLWKE